MKNELRKIHVYYYYYFKLSENRVQWANGSKNKHTNEKELKSKELMLMLEDIPVKYKDMKFAAKNYNDEDKGRIASLMQSVLKDEWNRVRDGEILWSFNSLFGGNSFLHKIYISRIRLFWILITAIPLFLAYTLYS